MSRRDLGHLWILGALLLACSAPAPKKLHWAPPGEHASVRPSLEEIFSDPPIHGNPPRIERLSPDGRFLLFYWSTLSPEELEGNYLDLRILDVTDPAATQHVGKILINELPELGRPSDEVELLGPVEWSHRGHLLAIGRGADILIYDPATGDSAPLLLGETEPETPEGEAATDDAAPTEAAPVGPWIDGSIKSVAFQQDDRRLRFADRHELYDLPVDGLPERPYTLDEARWWSEDLDARALSLRWSHELDVVFGLDPLPLEAEEGEERAPVHVYRLDEKRGVTLADLSDPDHLERAAISPGGRFVFAAEYDRSGEPEPTLVPDYLTERVTTRKGRRQLADGTPSPFELRIWRTSNGQRVSVLPRGGPVTQPPVPEEGAEDAPPPQGNYWLRTIGWAPQPRPNSPARFAFELWSADWRELSLWVWTEGYSVPVWTERDGAWVGGEARYTRWTPDGSRLILGSECAAGLTTPGRSQLFSIDPDTGESVQLSAVEGAVRGYNLLQDGGLLFRASRQDPGRLSIGYLTADMVAGNFRPEVRWLETPEGWNSNPAGARDGSRVVYTHERLFQPIELRTFGPEGDVELTRTRPEAFRRVDWIHPRRIKLTSSDGRDVHAHVYLPRGTSLEASNRQPRRATLVFVHGAGYLQNVTDSMTRYPMNLLFHSRLAEMGYLVLDVDYRGSAGYGRDFRTDVQYHLGGKDLEDIHLVVDELTDRGLVDPARVGIYGGSYGGFMTLMALFTAPDRWSAGAALRSVTDWRTYHPSYTQPRLGRPTTHPEAFAKSSPLDHAQKLEDPLLILHGMMDSNVFAQDSVRLIEELIDEGLEFDAMLYPSQGHGFSDAAHWLDEYRRIERFFLQHLGPPVSGS